MNYKLIKVRNKILYKVWENVKSEIDMDDMAEIFDIPLSTFYRILKEEKLKVKTK